MEGFPMANSQPQKTMRELIAEFLRVTPHIKAYSAGTIHQYRFWLEHWEEWITAQVGGEAGLDTWTYENLLAFTSARITKHRYKANSANAMLSALSSFEKWLRRGSLITEMPSRDLERIKVKKTARSVASDKDVFGMVGAVEWLPADESQKLFVGALINLLAWTGLRYSELIHLKVDDVDLDARTIVVQEAKGGGTRTFPLCSQAIEPLKRYLEARPETEKTEFLVYKRGLHVSTLGRYKLNKIVKHLKAVAHIPEGHRMNPHAWRHSYATRLLVNSNYDYRSVADVLGHAQTSTTMNIYSHTTDARTRALVELGAVMPELPGVPKPPPSPEPPASPPPGPRETPGPTTPIDRMRPRRRVDLRRKHN